MLTLIKTVHTIIWAVMAFAILYALVAGLRGIVDPIVLSCLGLVLLESLVLVFNKMTCPLTPMARRYSSDNRDNFDIYLPEWLARHNKTIFGTLFAAALLLAIRNSLF